LQEDKNICASFRCASVRKTDIASLHHQEIIATMTDYAISVCDLELDTSAEPRQSLDARRVADPPSSDGKPSAHGRCLSLNELRTLFVEWRLPTGEALTSI
jgi:hypothetical protein